MYQEDPLDRWSRIILAWMVWAEREIEIDLWYLWRRSCIEARHLRRMFLIKTQAIVKRLWIELYYDLISPALIFFRLKRIRSWTAIEEDVKQFEAETGQPFPRTLAYIEGLKREQAKQAKREA